MKPIIKKIGIDARFYGPKGKGLGRYVQKLIENLEKIDGDSDRQYFVFLRKSNFESYVPQKSNFKKIIADYSWYSFSEQSKFPFFLRKFNLDLMHFCHFNVPLLYRKNFVVTIHDLILFHYPTIRNTTLNRYFYFLKLMAYQKVIRSAALRSQKIIAVSQFTKEDVVNNLHIEKEKIFVTHEGCDWSCVYSSSSQSEHVLRDYGIIKPYLLYIGNAYPHKNLERLCLAFRQVQSSYSDLQLVLVGEKDFFYQRLQQYIKKEGIENVVLTGFVADQQLDVIYKEALLYVFPSLYEGFGLPPLEALAKRTPVISSDRTSMPEVLGSGALYFDPQQVQSISDAIIQGISSEELRKDIVEKGVARLEKFSWEEMAKKTRNVYIGCLEK